MKDRQIYEMNKKWREYRLEEDKEPLHEGKTSLPEVADLFARFLIGDRKLAIRQLNMIVKDKIGNMEEPGEYWNKQYVSLVTDITKALKKNL